jgi:hypothetical protein
MEVMGFSFVRIRYVSCHDGCGHTMALPDGILLRDPHEVGADPSARCQDGLKCGVPQWINPRTPIVADAISKTQRASDAFRAGSTRPREHRVPTPWMYIGR